MRAEAQRLLADMLGAGAQFRDGQFEAIERVVARRERLLLVQRTGWGKSLVYFLSTRMLRDRGAGPTLLISPLLALMRNQVEMAGRIGIRAATINSANVAEWQQIEEALRGDAVDVLLISPERLGSERFADQALPAVGGRAGLFVIDEAHCISDWGHDFRPDYRRIARILNRLPPNIPVLATTATANSRVVEDVLAQLEDGAGAARAMTAMRGPLARASLRLQTLIIPGQAERMAWLAQHIPQMPGSGIVYCLTIPDVWRVAGFLRERGVKATAYWGGLDNDRRLEAEAALQNNEIKALVSTTALGMGYDKPDLGFVVHFQSPGSLVAYYQQVGRAGRALDEACGVMLAGEEDDEINDYFMRTAFPATKDMEEIVGVLGAADGPMSRGTLESAVNISYGHLDHCLKMLEIDGVVARHDGRYFRTLNAWTPDRERERRVTEIRRHERERVLEYARARSCLMRFLVRELDGEMNEPCGRCAVCAGDLFASRAPGGLARKARRFLKEQAIAIPVRTRWPPSRDGTIKPIAAEHRAREGYALSHYGDAGWGAEVARTKYGGGATDRGGILRGATLRDVIAGALGRGEPGFSDELIRAAAEFIARRWSPDPFPAWLTFVPSLARPRLVADFATRLARRLDIEYVEAIEKTRENHPQKLMENSYQQAANIWRAFAVVKDRVRAGPVLLVDDIVDSGWTLTVLAVKLRQAGAGDVHPFALASAAKGR